MYITIYLMSLVLVYVFAFKGDFEKEVLDKTSPIMLICIATILLMTLVSH